MIAFRRQDSPGTTTHADEKPSLEHVDRPEPDKSERTPHPTARLRRTLRTTCGQRRALNRPRQR